MGTKNRVLVLSKDERIFRDIQKALVSENNIGECEWKETAIAGLAAIRQIRPDIILLDEELCYPDVSAAVKEFILKLPEVRIILLAQMGRRDKIDAAILAGAAGYLLKPVDNIEVVTTVQRVLVNFTPGPAATINEPVSLPTGKIVSLFSTVDGVGKTTIAVNMAILLAKLSGEKVCLVDADLQFGDVCRYLYTKPKATIAEFAAEGANSGHSIREYLQPWGDSLDVLAAPGDIEQGQLVTPVIMDAALKELSCIYKYVVVDLPMGFNDVNLDVLELASTILLVNTLDSIACVKNLRLGINTLRELGYTKDKVHLILNRYKAKTAIGVEEVEKALQGRFTARIGNDFGTASGALQARQPMVLYQPNREVSQDIADLAKRIIEERFHSTPESSSFTDRLSRWLKG